jgi:protein subunit release factor A
MNNTQLHAFVRQVILEAKAAKDAKKPKKISVSDHIKMIDEAGNKAAVEAKTTEIEKMIQAIEHIKSTIDSLEHFNKVVSANTAKGLATDLDKSLAELNKKKEELEKQVKSIEAPVAKEKVDEKLNPDMGAGVYVKDFKKSKAPQFQGKSAEKKDKMAVAAFLSAKNK